jgi:hypothetical protein
MKDYLFIYRADYKNAHQGNTPEEKEVIMKQWMDWMGSIAAQNKLSAKGSPLAGSGKVVKSDNIITNGPYSEIKEVVGGYSIVKADSYDGAVELAKGCPILKIGGNVEIREVVAM